MHTKEKCWAFSCPKFTFNNENEGKEPECGDAHKDEEIDYSKIDFAELSDEESNEAEEAEIDYGEENE